MTREQATAHVKNQLGPYLNSITTRKGKHYVCPICKSGTGPNQMPAGSVMNNLFHCFSCGFRGDVIDLIGIIEQIADNKDCFNRAYELFGITIDGERTVQKKQVQEEQRDYIDYFLKANKILHENPEALKYIASRGISIETADRFKIGYDKAWRSPAEEYK